VYKRKSYLLKISQNSHSFPLFQIIIFSWALYFRTLVKIFFILPSLTDILSCHFPRDLSTNKLLYALLFFPARLRSQHTSLWISSLCIYVFHLILSLVFLVSNLLIVPKIKRIRFTAMQYNRKNHR
jgi:hypothetical protein